jgi:hypothetical protein
MKTPITDLITREIKWCEAHRHDPAFEFQEGFIAGLEQARALARQAERLSAKAEKQRDAVSVHHEECD